MIRSPLAGLRPRFASAFFCTAFFISISFASAQVLKCVDANGKVTYADASGCATSPEPAQQVLGRSATDQRDEPEGYQRQLQMEGIQRARGLKAATVDSVTQQSQGGADAGLMGQQPARRPADDPAPAGGLSSSCDTYSPRQGCIGGSRATNPTWSPRAGYTGGNSPEDRQRDEQTRQRNEAVARETAARAADAAKSVRRQITNCAGGYCHDNNGTSYSRDPYNTLHGNDGSTCTPAGAGRWNCH